MSTDLPPLVARDDGTVLISGAALPLLYRCVLAGIARQHRDGIATSPLLHQIRTVLFQAATSPTRHMLAETPPTTPCCESQNVSDLLSVGEAAALLRLSRRQIQRMAQARRLQAVRVGRIWALHRAPVLALAQRKAAAR